MENYCMNRINVDTAANDGATLNVSFNKMNYMAIAMLETLGLRAPSQEQIDMVEALLTFFKRTLSEFDRDDSGI